MLICARYDDGTLGERDSTNFNTLQVVFHDITFLTKYRQVHRNLSKISTSKALNKDYWDHLKLLV